MTPFWLEGLVPWQALSVTNFIGGLKKKLFIMWKWEVAKVRVEERQQNICEWSDL